MRAHTRVQAIDEERSTALQVAFRDEIGAVVRSASPFLRSLLGIEGLTLDEAVMCLEAQPGWPRRPRLAGLGPKSHGSYNQVLRHYPAGLLANGLSQPPLHGCRISIAGGGWTRI